MDESYLEKLLDFAKCNIEASKESFENWKGIYFEDDELRYQVFIENHLEMNEEIMLAKKINEMEGFRLSSLEEDILSQVIADASDLYQRETNNLLDYLNDFRSCTDSEKTQNIKSIIIEIEELNKDLPAKDYGIKIKDIMGYAASILNHISFRRNCINKIEALESDRAIDAYQDTQPGGGSCLYRNIEETKKHEDMLENMSIKDVFPEIITKENCSILEELVEKIDEIHKPFVLDYCFDPACNLFFFIDQVSESIETYVDAEREISFLEIPLNTKSIQKLIDAAQFITKEMVRWDDTTETAKTEMNIEEVFSKYFDDYINNTVKLENSFKKR